MQIIREVRIPSYTVFFTLQAGKLTLGKINELGQFVSEVEPEPDIEKKKKGTFILKKRKEKEKVLRLVFL